MEDVEDKQRPRFIPFYFRAPLGLCLVEAVQAQHVEHDNVLPLNVWRTLVIPRAALGECDLSRPQNQQACSVPAYSDARSMSVAPSSRGYRAQGWWGHALLLLFFETVEANHGVPSGVCPHDQIWAFKHRPECDVLIFHYRESRNQIQILASVDISATFRCYSRGVLAEFALPRPAVRALSRNRSHIAGLSHTLLS